MSKNKKRKNINFTTEGSILQQFIEFMNTEQRSVNDIIAFLHVQNAVALTYADKEVPQEKRDEIATFYTYFMDNFGNITLDARMYEWGCEPLILRMGNQFCMELYKKERDDYLRSLPVTVRKEAGSLCDRLFSIRAERFFTLGVSDDYCVTFELEAVIPRASLDDARNELLIMCVDLIENSSSLVVRCRYRDRTEIFGVEGDNGRWIPIPKKKMLDAHTLAPNGMRLKPEPGVVYTEIAKKSEKNSNWKVLEGKNNG